MWYCVDYTYDSEVNLSNCCSTEKIIFTYQRGAMRWRCNLSNSHVYSQTHMHNICKSVILCMKSMYQLSYTCLVIPDINTEIWAREDYKTHMCLEAPTDWIF